VRAGVQPGDADAPGAVLPLPLLGRGTPRRRRRTVVARPRPSTAGAASPFPLNTGAVELHREKFGLLTDLRELIDLIGPRTSGKTSPTTAGSGRDFPLWASLGRRPSGVSRPWSTFPSFVQSFCSNYFRPALVNFIEILHTFS
jgi:hypothetical protein